MCGGVRPRPAGVLMRRLDRRAVLKGAATAGALSLVGAGVTRQVAAQDGGGTRAETWVEGDNAGPHAAVGAASTEGTTFQANFTFYAVAPHWSGDVDFDPLIQISVSSDGSDWSDAMTVGAATTDAGPPDRDGRQFGELVFVPDGASFVRYNAVDSDGDPRQVGGLAFTYIDASNGPSVSDVGAAATDPSIAPPPVISRADWGCDESLGLDVNGQLIWPPEYQTVEHVIVHHADAGVDNFYDPLLFIRSIYYYHTVTRGWGDIGYNYLVDFMGHIYEGRKGGANVVGGHAYQYAHGSSGICVMGTFSTLHETPEALSGLTWITAWTGRNLDPYGHADFHETAGLATICGHRDVLSTTCPGDMLYADLPTLRDRVNAVLNQGVDPSQHPQFNKGDTVTVIVDRSNLRASPGTNYSVVTTMPVGTTLTISDGPATNGGYTWYEVTGDVGDGWVASTLIELQSSNGGSGKFKNGDTVVVSTDLLNLRDAPGLGGNVVAKMPTGTQGTVIDGPQTSGGYDWFKLNTSSATGWAADAYLDLASSAPSGGKFQVGDQAVVDTDRLNLRSSPSLSASVLATLPNGAQGKVTDGPQTADGSTWYQLSTSYGTGWSVDAYLAAASSGQQGKFKIGDAVSVSTDTLNLRAAPGLSASVVAKLPNGTALTVTDGPSKADGYTWWGVKSNSYGTGWCAEDYLVASSSGNSNNNGTPPPSGGLTVGGEAKVIDGRLNMRSAAGLANSVVAVLPDGTMLDVLYGPISADGYDWYQVRNSTYGTGWCVAQYLQPA